MQVITPLLSAQTGRLLLPWLLAGLPLWPAAVQADPACAGAVPEVALQHVNAARARGLLCGGEGTAQRSAALAWSPVLARAAQQQADWLARHGALLHTGPRGESLAARAAAAGYSHARISENLSAGQDSVAGALRAWEASTAHCRNLADAAVTETALACAKGPDGEPFWVQLLARPR